MAVHDLSGFDDDSTNGVNVESDLRWKKFINTESNDTVDSEHFRETNLTRNKMIVSGRTKSIKQSVQFPARKRASDSPKRNSGQARSNEESFEVFPSPLKRQAKEFDESSENQGRVDVSNLVKTYLNAKNRTKVDLDVRKQSDVSGPLSQKKFFTSSPNVASKQMQEKSPVVSYGNNTVSRYTPWKGHIYKPNPSPKRLTLSSAIDKSPQKSFTDHDNKENSDLSLSFRYSNLGFYNFGNTCYMSAVLQALYSLHSFSAELLTAFEQIKDVLESKNSAYGAICTLLKERNKAHSSNSWNNYKDNLMDVKRAMDASCANFQGSRMQDGHEFHIKLIETVNKEITQALSKSPIANLNNPIEDNFQLTQVETVKCEKCDHIVTRPENDYNIGLSVPKRRINGKLGSLQCSLQSNFRDEQREFICSECQHDRSKAITKISKVPKILTLFLKRYKLAEDGRIVKDDTPTFVPHFLTLMDFMSESDKDIIQENDLSNEPTQDDPNQEGNDGKHQNINLDDRFEQNYDTGDMPLSYQLMSVVCHHGDRPDMGHYVCYGVNVSKRAYQLYDDKSVQSVSKDTFLTDVKKTGYIFLYAKK